MQDLFGVHSFIRMPRRDKAAYGKFGVDTARAVVDFQTNAGFRTVTPAGTRKRGSARQQS